MTANLVRKKMALVNDQIDTSIKAFVNVNGGRPNVRPLRVGKGTAGRICLYMRRASACAL